MNLWITRPDSGSVSARGLRRCDAWIYRPHFDRRPRGDRDLPMYSEQPIGWSVIDPSGRDISSQCHAELGKLTRPYEREEAKIFKEIFLHCCPMVIETEFDQDDFNPWPHLQESSRLDFFDRKSQDFLLELDVHPGLWIAVLQKIESYEVERAAAFQSWLRGDIPF